MADPQEMQTEGAEELASSERSRTRLVASAKNVAVAWAGQAFSVLLAFVARGVFAHYLAQDYLTLENTFSNVLTILSLAELGVGSAIVFSLYEPLAVGDKEVVKSLMRLFRRAYIAIGVTVAVVGLGLSFYLDFLIKDMPDLPNIRLYFLCFVANTSVSYFFSYKGLLLGADQKQWIVSIYTYAFQAAMSIAQIVVLMITRSYLLFLVCMIASTLLQNICISIATDRAYPYLKEKDIKPIPKDTSHVIKQNIVGLLIHRIAGIASTPLSSLAVSMFVGARAIALFGNYMMVTNAISRIIQRFFDAITASIGNLKVTESEERSHQVFLATFLINACIYAGITVPTLCLFDPVVEVWLGADYILPKGTVILVVALFYLKGMRSTVLSFTSAYGLFWQTKWKAIIETVVMVALTFALVMGLEIDGVLWAGILSNIFVSTTIEAYLQYKYGFHRSPKRYFALWLIYTAVILGIGAGCFVLCGMLPPMGLALTIIVRLFLSVAITVVVFALIFHRTAEWKEAAVMMGGIKRSLLAKLHRKPKQEEPEQEQDEGGVVE